MVTSTGDTTISATASTNGSISYGGLYVDTSAGTISKLSVNDAAVTLSGLVNASEIDLTGATTPTVSGTTKIKADTISTTNSILSSLLNNDNITLMTATTGSNLTISTTDTLSDAVIESLKEKTSYKITVTLTNNGTESTFTGTKGKPNDSTATDRAAAVALGQAMSDAAEAVDPSAVKTADEHAANLSKDLFSHTLPSAKDLDVASKLDAYFAAKNAYETKLATFDENDKTYVEETVAGVLGTNASTLNSMTLSALSSSSTNNAQAAHDAVVAAGRTLVAPVAGASRAAALIERATESNIIRRTEVLRNRPPKTVRPLDSKLEGKDELMNENIWADVRYNNVDIDTNEYCGKSNVAIANYQLGCDRKISDADYVGAFIGTTRGDFNFYSYSTGTSDGTVSLKGAFNAGIYGTHILPKGHYIDYLLHYSKFDNDFADKGIQWKTQSIGAMILMGWKKTLDHGYLNPYVSLSTQKISNDDMRWCGNVLATKDQTNTGVKIGVDYSYNGGAFGGIAYSRGLSGHLAAAVNDIALPSLKNDEQIL